MSKFIPIPDSKELKIEWVELDSRIYCGDDLGYTESIHMDPDSEPRPGSVACEAHWNEEDHWGFIFKGGHVCFINSNRIRYVKGSLRNVTQSETERDDVVHVKEGIEERADDVIHSETVTPKRRGRPPKVKPE